MNAEDLPEFAKLVTMPGKLTDARDEKRTKGFLFTQFWGTAKKHVQDEVSEDNFQEGVIDVILANKSKNAFHHLIYGAKVITEGEMWCGDTVQLSKICTGIDVQGEIMIRFSREVITFVTPEVSLEMRNDDLDALETIKLAKDMYSKLDTTDTTVWKYKDREMPVIVKIELNKLAPVMKDSDLVGQLHYPFSIKKYTEGGEEKYLLHVEARRPDKITIKRDVKDIDVTGDECESAYSVGLDSIVTNLAGNTVMLRLGNWVPMIVESDTKKYHSVMLLANLVKENADENLWSEDDVFADDEDSGDEEEDTSSDETGDEEGNEEDDGVVENEEETDFF
jgi:hypothetical protein